MNMYTPERLPNETFDEYKARRAEANLHNKAQKKANWLPTRFIQRVLTKKEKQ